MTRNVHKIKTGKSGLKKKWKGAKLREHTKRRAEHTSTPGQRVRMEEEGGGVMLTERQREGHPLQLVNITRVLAAGTKLPFALFSGLHSP